MKRWMVCLVLGITLPACGSDSEPRSGGADSRSGDVDYCEEFGWYNDGHCDDVCSSPDPDCDPENTDPGRSPSNNTWNQPDPDPDPLPDPQPDPDPGPDPDPLPNTCADDRPSTPFCASGEVPVDAMTCLAAGDDCVSTRSECDIWSHCLYVGEVCPDVEGLPAGCPENTVEVDACTSEDCSIVHGSGDQCADFALCEPTTTCLGLATCAEGEINVSTEQCFEFGDSCSTHTYCSQTMHCIDEVRDCPAVVGASPACAVGQTEVGGCTTTELNNRTCTFALGTGDQCSEFVYCVYD